MSSDNRSYPQWWSWVRFIAWALWDIARHPIQNVRNFRATFREGYELGKQGYSFDVSELAFKRRVGTFTRREDGSWAFDPSDSDKGN